MTGDFARSSDLAPRVEESLINEDFKRHLKSWIKQLTGREQQILTLRFGLDGGDPKTLGEIGFQFGVCRERIRQIQLTAIKKLRKSNEVQTIASFF